MSFEVFWDCLIYEDFAYFVSDLYRCYVKFEKPHSFAISFCFNFALMDLISMNRAIKFSSYWQSIKLASRFPALDISPRQKVLFFY